MGLIVAKTTLTTIEEIRKRLEKKYSGATELFPDFSTAKRIEVISTASPVINAVTGIGGIPRGRITEIFGSFSTGKTTIAIAVAAELQKKDPQSTVLFVDYEHAFDASYAHKLGVDLNPERFIFTQPETFEQGHDAIDEFVDAGVVDLVVIDSAAAMTPQNELEGDVDASQRLGHQAQLMAKFLTRITKKLHKGKSPALLILNQTRTKIDLRNPRATKEDAAGGNALKFYTSIRIELQQMHKDGDESRDAKSSVPDQVYKRTWVRLTGVKNKLAPPFIRGKIAIDFGTGINNLISLGEMAIAKLGIMSSGGGHFLYEGKTQETTVKGRSKETFLKLLETNEALRLEIEDQVMQKMEVSGTEFLGLRDIKESVNPSVIVIESSPEELDLESPIELNVISEGMPTKEMCNEYSNTVD